jgi:hypothetical protein
MLISTPATGIPKMVPGVYLASGTLNNWCQGDFGFQDEPQLRLDTDQKNFIIDATDLLDIGDEFKLVIPYFGAEQAARAYAARLDAAPDTPGGVHSSQRFDLDPNTGHFWLLANSHPVVRPGLWNQNNIYVDHQA